MRRRIPPPVVAALVLLWHVGASGALPLATGSDAEVTEEGLHRVHASVMEAAWVKPDLDLSRYSRALLVPTAVQFREVKAPVDPFSRTRSRVAEFPLDDQRKDWLRGVWSRAVQEEFARQETLEPYPGVGSDVLVVQGLLVDLVSRIPPDAAGSSYTWVKDPWAASVVLELRDGMTGDLLARTIDRRYGEGLIDSGTIWMLTEGLLERWAEVLFERLEELSDLGSQSDLQGPRQ